MKPLYLITNKKEQRSNKYTFEGITPLIYFFGGGGGGGWKEEDDEKRKW